MQIGHVGTRRDVDVAQVTCGADRCEEPVVAEKREAINLRRVIAQAVQLRPASIVDVQILVLRCREHRLIAQEGDVAHGLANMDLLLDRRALPVDDREVALAAAEE